jgi:SAM-dependent methyltransferase
MAKDTYLKFIVQSTYNKQAGLYRKYSELQKVNLQNLISHAEKWNTKVIPGLLLDAGCGIPDKSFLKRKIFSNLISGYVGIDLSFNMLSASVSNEPGTRVNADLEAIPFKPESFSVVISNSVLHWLNFPEQNLNPLTGCKEIFNVLKQNGAFILSVSGIGTAQRFQKVFYEVSKTVPDSFFENRSLLRRDPIGSMELHELIKVLKLAGFTISHALMEYEPVFFEKTNDYISHVKAYGEDIYLSAFKKQHRDTVWKMVSEQFEYTVGKHNYEHDQFMIYAVALKT